MRINKTSLVEATIDDALALTGRLCDMDILEAELSLGKRQADGAVIFSFARSHICRSVYIDEQVEAMMGIANYGNEDLLGLKSCGTIWGLSSSKAHNYPLSYMFYGKMLIVEALQTYEKVINYVYIDNTKSIRWLEMLGAEFSEPITYGACGEKLFRRFEICAYQHP